MEELFKKGENVIPSPDTTIPTDTYIVESTSVVDGKKKVTIKSKSGSTHVVDQDDLYVGMME
jgi:hypothetical protein